MRWVMAVFYFAAGVVLVRIVLPPPRTQFFLSLRLFAFCFGPSPGYSGAFASRSEWGLCAETKFGVIEAD
jgi:hypothetical protein